MYGSNDRRWEALLRHLVTVCCCHAFEPAFTSMLPTLQMLRAGLPGSCVRLLNQLQMVCPCHHVTCLPLHPFCNTSHMSRYCDAGQESVLCQHRSSPSCFCLFWTAE